MRPDEVDELDDEVFDAMVRHMKREADAVKAAASKARR
jgi:hypothetical protein